MFEARAAPGRRKVLTGESAHDDVNLPTQRAGVKRGDVLVQDALAVALQHPAAERVQLHRAGRLPTQHPAGNHRPARAREQVQRAQRLAAPERVELVDGVLEGHRTLRRSARSGHRARQAAHQAARHGGQTRWHGQ